MQPFPSKGIILLILLTGLGLFSVGVHQALEARDFSESALRADGVVVRLIQVASRNGKSGYTYSPVVEYSDENGAIQRYTTTKSSSVISVGDHMQILINRTMPDSPYSIELKSYIYSDAIFYISVGSIMTILAFGLFGISRGWWQARTRRSSRHRPPA